VGKGKRADVYLEVRKRRVHIFFEWNKCLWRVVVFKATFNNISVLLVVEGLAPFVAHVVVLILIIRLQVMNKEMTCFVCNLLCLHNSPQALVSFKKYMHPPLPYFKVNICPFPFPHFASIFFAYLWSFRWPNYIATLPGYFSLLLLHLNIPTGPPSHELDKNISERSLFYS
jgi:hypothetical protein